MNFLRIDRSPLPGRRVVALLSPLLVVALLASACSGDDEEGGGSEESTPSSVELVETPEGCEDTSDAPDDPVLAEIDERGKPTVDVPDPVPTELTTTDIVVGEGDEVIPEGTVEVHYLLTGADGTEIESSWESGEPVPIPLASVFPGFAEGMEGMKVGGRRQIIVPAADSYGDNPPPGITAGDPIVFVVDLVSVSEDAAATTVDADEDAAAAAEERGEPEVTVPEEVPEELTIIDEVVGDGDVVCPGDTVLAHYVGKGANTGEVFDSSWERGEPAEFPLDGVIEGWTKGLPGMKVGGRRTLIIPGDMAYGENPGSPDIEPNETLIFTIDMVGTS